MLFAWTLLDAAPAGQTPAPGGGNMLITFLPFILVFAIMYFLMIRPQAKKAKELAKMLQSITPGTEVVTTGGIHGIVKGAKGQNNEILILQIAEGIKIDVDRAAVTRIATADGK